MKQRRWREILTLVHLVKTVAVILAVDTVNLFENILLDGLEDYKLKARRDRFVRKKNLALHVPGRYE
jgi:hypothetical protein